MKQNSFKIRATVHVLFFRDNNVLMLLRKNVSLDGLYSLVAGHVDEGETVTQAIIREAKEEAGINIDAKDIEIKTVCHSYSRHNDREFIQFYAVCKKWHGEIKNNEPDKCGELKFFPVDNLPDNIVPYIRDAINKVLSGVVYYEYGWEEGEV